MKMIVATHKRYSMPADGVYLPVQAGASLHASLGYTGDDTGENISSRNGTFCELTALYWGWKNLPGEDLGLCHYRRYFREPGSGGIARGETLEKILREVPVILPVKRNYWIETGESQFVHAHGEESLTVLRGVLADLYPEYLDAFNRSMGRTSGHRFNMAVMRREALDAYCEWLFGILFEVEKRMETVPERMAGFLAERLMDAWIETTGTEYRELGVYHTEKTNWVKKGGAFLGRKFGYGKRGKA